MLYALLFGQGGRNIMSKQINMNEQLYKKGQKTAFVYSRTFNIHYSFCTVFMLYATVGVGCVQPIVLFIRN